MAVQYDQPLTHLCGAVASQTQSRRAAEAQAKTDLDPETPEVFVTTLRQVTQEIDAADDGGGETRVEGLVWLASLLGSRAKKSAQLAYGGESRGGESREGGEHGGRDGFEFLLRAYASCLDAMVLALASHAGGEGGVDVGAKFPKLATFIRKRLSRQVRSLRSLVPPTAESRSGALFLLFWIDAGAKRLVSLQDGSAPELAASLLREARSDPLAGLEAHSHDLCRKRTLSYEAVVLLRLATRRALGGGDRARDVLSRLHALLADTSLVISSWKLGYAIAWFLTELASWTQAPSLSYAVLEASDPSTDLDLLNLIHLPAFADEDPTSFRAHILAGVSDGIRRAGAVRSHRGNPSGSPEHHHHGAGSTRGRKKKVRRVKRKKSRRHSKGPGAATSAGTSAALSATDAALSATSGGVYTADARAHTDTGATSASSPKKMRKRVVRRKRARQAHVPSPSPPPPEQPSLSHHDRHNNNNHHHRHHHHHSSSSRQPSSSSRRRSPAVTSTIITTTAATPERSPTPELLSSSSISDLLVSADGSADGSGDGSGDESSEGSRIIPVRHSRDSLESSGRSRGRDGSRVFPEPVASPVLRVTDASHVGISSSQEPSASFLMQSESSATAAELSRTKSRLATTTAALEDARTSLDAQTSAFENESARMHEVQAGLQTQISALYEENARLADAVEAARVSASAATGSASSLRAHNAVLKSRLEEANIEVSSLRAEVEVLSRASRKPSAETSRLKARTVDLEAQRDALAERLNAAESAHKSLSGAHQRLLDSFRDLEVEADRSSNLVHTLELERDALSREVLETRKARDALSSRVSSLCGALEEEGGARAATAGVMTTLKARVLETLTRARTAEAGLAQLKRENQGLRDNMATLEHELEMAISGGDGVHRLHSLVSAMKEELLNAHADRNALATSLKNVEAERDEHAERAEKFGTLLETSLSSNAFRPASTLRRGSVTMSPSSELQRLREANERLRDEKTVLNAQERALRDAVDELQSELDAQTRRLIEALQAADAAAADDAFAERSIALQMRNIELQAELGGAETRSKELQRELQAQYEARQAASLKITELQRENATLVQSRTEQMMTDKALRNQMLVLKNHLSTLERQIAEAQSQ